MYHLPPSPSRPAPVLDRGGKSLERPGLRREQTGELQPPPRRQPKNSVSEGELTDDQARAERVQRQRNKFLNNMMNKGSSSRVRARPHSAGGSPLATGSLQRLAEGGSSEQTMG